MWKKKWTFFLGCKWKHVNQRCRGVPQLVKSDKPSVQSLQQDQPLEIAGSIYGSCERVWVVIFSSIEILAVGQRILACVRTQHKKKKKILERSEERNYYTVILHSRGCALLVMYRMYGGTHRWGGQAVLCLGNHGERMWLGSAVCLKHHKIHYAGENESSSSLRRTERVREEERGGRPGRDHTGGIYDRVQLTIQGNALLDLNPFATTGVCKDVHLTWKMKTVSAITSSSSFESCLVHDTYHIHVLYRVVLWT